MQKVRMMKRFADFLIEAGLKPLPQREVVIFADVEMSFFVGYLVGELYKNRAKDIYVNYLDTNVSRIWLNNTPESKLKLSIKETLKQFGTDGENSKILIHLVSRSWDSIKKIHPEKADIARKAFNEQIDSIKPYLTDRVRHIVAYVPTRSWAAEVFPDLTPSQALDRMWEIMFEGLGIDSDQDIPSMAQMIAPADAFCSRVNSLRLTDLKIFSQTTGTDLSIRLPAKSIWRSGVRTEVGTGVRFFSYFPSGGAYVSPHFLGADGTLVSTAPIFLRGEKVENLRLRFQKGEVIEAVASTGQNVVDDMLKDPTARRLGFLNIGLLNVPQHAAMSGMGSWILDMSNPLSFALGQSVADTLQDSETMKREERMINGLNQSSVRVPIPAYAPDIQILGEGRDNAGKLVAVDVVKDGKAVY